MNKVILVGYMAVGKTTIASLLSEKIGLKMVDLDILIEEKINLSVTEIFKEKGEIFFRKVEHEIFKELLESKEDLIISTGGGTPCYANNHLLLNTNSTTSIYLKASLECIFERLKSAKINRPLVSNQSDAELKEFIAKHIFERSFFYNQATFNISIDNKNPEVIVREIVHLLH